jgi:hypothetical protein
MASGFSSYDNCQGSDWINGGIIAGCTQIIIKKGDEYIAIKSRFDLQNIFSPITDRKEAISYASAYLEYFPITKMSFFEDSYTYSRSKKISYADSASGYYIAHLYDYKSFGCGPHPYYYVAVKVFRNGDVEELQKAEAFRDASDDNLCVD